MMAAVIANKVGFEIVYGTGYWLTASAFGLPDAGIVTYTQMLDRVSTLARTSNAAVIADADTGYGGLLNVHHTVRGYEEAGITAIQIEDQQFPKKCGHTPGKKCVPLEEMIDKIGVACEARRDPKNTLIIARTDVRQAEGFDSAIKRGAAFAEAGADIVETNTVTSTAISQTDNGLEDLAHKLNFEAAQIAVGAPIPGKLDAGPHELARMLLELAFEALEQGEGIGRGAGEPGDDLAAAEPAHLARIGFDHGIPQRHLAVAGDDNDAEAVAGSAALLSGAPLVGEGGGAPFLARAARPAVTEPRRETGSPCRRL